MLTNATGSLALVTTRIGSNQAGVSFVFKVTATYTAAGIAAYTSLPAGLYSIALSAQATFPVFLQANSTSPGYVPPTAAVIKTRESIYLQRAGVSTTVQFGLFAGSFLLNATAATVLPSLTFIQLSNPLPVTINQVSNGPQLVSQFRGIYEKYGAFTSVQFMQPTFSAKLTIAINGFGTQLGQS